ncbi:hypothetical protein SAMN02745824_0664 [Parasphingorhabdus marina DSM 22363]|uniref:Uncharacterized protein n=1 Tax=Parasphingorhabdus marina DSM 22363 TaxID=1123272 RepID=A0A1N6CPJ6_9SPHN|nr:hypothetical protein [Parasphingorhabdus marina]SIN60432.1 hypothetical protein SAMN02745824_0664 [Parasphingorhabdus marina DSM 22363]
MLLFDNSTQAAGLLAFLIAFGCCLIPGRRGAWSWLAAIYLALAIEMMVETRHGLRLLVNDVMQRGGLYADRTGYQLAIAGLLTILVLAVLYQVAQSGLWRKSSRAAKTAGIATLILLLLFVVELLSLHAIDALLYQTTGGLMRVGWSWIVLAGVTAISAIFQGRAAAPQQPDHGETKAD